MRQAPAALKSMRRNFTFISLKLCNFTSLTNRMFYHVKNTSTIYSDRLLQEQRAATQAKNIYNIYLYHVITKTFYDLTIKILHCTNLKILWLEQ